MDYLISEWHHIVRALMSFEFTTWKIIGFVGMGLFTSRWLVQMYYTRKFKRVTMPLAFWLLSVCGSVMLLAYWVFGKNDSVGILSTLFPAFVSVYNLVIHVKHHKNTATGDPVG